MERTAEEEAGWDVRGGFDLEVLDEAGGRGAILHAQEGRFEEASKHLIAAAACASLAPWATPS